MIGNIDKTTDSVSTYQPSQEVIDLTVGVKEDYSNGSRIIEKPWRELNDRSVIGDENNGQAMFNAFVDTSEQDVNEDWKWKGTKSKARNKGIAMHAQLSANYILPLFSAQNADDELDRDFSEVMRDGIEWMALPSNSNYQSSYLQMIFSMETNPVTFLEADFNDIKQTIKTRNDDGTIEKKEIQDEVLSGFRANIWGSSQILISNAYERNIQLQKNIIKRRYVEKSSLEAKWGDHPNWVFVQTGIKSIYNNEDGLFYDIRDEDHPNLVAEETYLNRRDDMEVPYIGGIYM